MVSIIVPIYNSEKYLRPCIESLCNQSHADIEIILVDDGSSDSSGAICDDFANKDPRIKVVHKQNGGVSAARNDGLDMACGKYIMFVDSDDFLHPQAMEICFSFAEKDSSDLVAFTYDRAYRTKLPGLGSNMCK